MSSSSLSFIGIAMSQRHLLDYMYVFLFLLMGLGAAVAQVVLSRLVSPPTLQDKTREPYECGMDPFGAAWDIRFNIAYYLYALIFLAFDVDILYLFPVATAFDRVSGPRGISELFLFVGILSLAIIYAWAKGVFSWTKKKPG
jgi:NADH:ubiquinone oxidoreductase subunit 3 (subunit A)